MLRRVRWGAIGGIPIGIDPSFFILCPIMVVFFFEYFGRLVRHSTWLLVLANSIVATALFVCSLLFHELGHASVARRLNLRVRRVRLFIFGGATDMTTRPTLSQQELLIALAGPLATLTFAGVMLAVSAFVRSTSATGMIAWVIGRINLYLMLLNMLPLFPFDGGRALRAILWRVYRDYSRADIAVRRVASAVAYILVIGGACLFLLKTAIWGVVCALAGWRLHNLLSSRTGNDLRISDEVAEVH